MGKVGEFRPYPLCEGPIRVRVKISRDDIHAGRVDPKALLDVFLVRHDDIRAGDKIAHDIARLLPVIPEFLPVVEVYGDSAPRGLRGRDRAHGRLGGQGRKGRRYPGEVEPPRIREYPFPIEGSRIRARDRASFPVVDHVRGPLIRPAFQIVDADAPGHPLHV